jgi:hypothetical protein
MTADQRTIVAALRGLAARWGVQSTALGGRLGPILLPLVGGAAGDNSSVLRTKTVKVLGELTADYPAVLRRTLLVALAVDADARFETLTKRQQVLADEFAWSSRTVRRRIDEAFVRLADDIAARDQAPGVTRRGA